MKPTSAPAVQRVNRAFAKLGYVTLMLAAVFNLGALWVTETSYDKLRANSEVTLRTQETLASIERIRTYVVDAETSQRGYVITGDTTYLVPLRAAANSLGSELSSLTELVKGNPVHDSLLEEIQRLTAEKMDEVEKQVELRRTDGFDAARAVVMTHAGKLTMATLRLALDGMAREEQRVRAVRVEGLRFDQRAIRLGVFAMALVNLLLVTFGVVFLWAELMRRSREAAVLAARGTQLSVEVDERTAQLRELSRFLENVREQEKGRVARDLHDELGGTLAAAKIDLQLLRDQVQSNAGVMTRLQRISAALDEAIAVKRRIIEDLRPTLLDNLGIGAALRWQCEEYAKRTNCPCNVKLAEEELKLAPEISIAIYRIVQEALTNTAKYAQAKNVDVSLDRDGERWHLRIFDDGVGIDLAKQHHPTSHGLISIRERVRALGGEVRFGGGPGMGTTVDVWFPGDATGGTVAREA
jgi:signal transduction histidine kinase